MNLFGKKENQKTEEVQLRKRKDELKKELESVNKKLIEIDATKNESVNKQAELKEDSATKDVDQPCDTLKQTSDDELLNEIKSKNDEIARLKAEIEKFETTVHQDKDSATNNETADILKELQKVTSRCADENKRLIKENADLSNKLDETQLRMEQIIQTCQEDRYRKDKIKLINKYIYQIDLIRKTLYDFHLDRHNMQDNEAVAYLENQLSEVANGLDATLLQEMVERKSFGRNGDPVNLEMQEVVGSFNTEDASLDGKIYQSINPGYVWTLPYILKAKVNDNGDEIKTYRFLLRSEQVIVYKHNKQ